MKHEQSVIEAETKRTLFVRFGSALSVLDAALGFSSEGLQFWVSGFFGLEGLRRVSTFFCLVPFFCPDR